MPSAPYGSSQASDSLYKTAPAAVNPQTPLLPPNFEDPGTMNPKKQAKNLRSAFFGDSGDFSNGGRGIDGRIMNE